MTKYEKTNQEIVSTMKTKNTETQIQKSFNTTEMFTGLYKQTAQ